MILALAVAAPALATDPPQVIYARLAATADTPWSTPFADAASAQTLSELGSPPGMKSVCGTFEPGNFTEKEQEHFDPESDAYRIYRWVELTYPSTTNRAAQATSLEATGLFDIVVSELPEMEYQQSGPDPLINFEPADPHRHQWWLTAAQFVGSPEQGLGAFHWTQGRVNVGVLDPGTLPSHPELTGNIRLHSSARVLPGKYDGAWNNPIILTQRYISPIQIDEHLGYRHGLHVTSIIASKRDNGAGGAGACPGCGLTLIATNDSSELSVAPPELFGTSNLPTKAHCIFSTNFGASVTNYSFTSPGFPEPNATATLEDAIAAAKARGAVLVASMGNDAKAVSIQRRQSASNSNQYFYELYPIPAALPNVIGVVGTDSLGRRWDELVLNGAQTPPQSDRMALTCLSSPQGVQIRL